MLCAIIVIAGTQANGQSSVQEVEPVVVAEDSLGCFTTIKEGENIYDISQYCYGNGEDWRWVVLNNPFLQKEGRVWQDSSSGKWYCKVFPGEVLYLPFMQSKKGEVENLKKSMKGLTVQEESWLRSQAFLFLKILACIIIIGLLLLYYTKQKNKKSEGDPSTASKAEGENTDKENLRDPLLDSTLEARVLNNTQISSESHQEVEKFLDVVEKLIEKNGTTHKLQIKITSGETVCELTLEPRFERKNTI